MVYLIEMLSTRTQQRLGYVMNLNKWGDPSYPMAFSNRAAAEKECERFKGYVRRRWRDYRVVERKQSDIKENRYPCAKNWLRA